MEKRVIDLEIIDDAENSGVSAIALVDVPAIERDWMAFRYEEFVEPSKGEHEDEFIPRCIAKLVGEEGYEPDQAAAICYSTWREAHSQEQFAKVSFDWDGTLATAKGLEHAKQHKEKGDTLYIISARNTVSQGMLDRGAELGIPPSRIFATGSNKAKVDKIKELGIEHHMDDNPMVRKAIGPIAMDFAAKTYTDYPEGAVNNAKRALAWAEKNGWGDCGMGPGKARANQLANREPISEDTIARMSAFERHRQNSDTPYSEGCGKLMWDAWGGDAGIRWAHNKLREIRGEDFSYDVSALPPYVDEVPHKKEDFAPASGNPGDRPLARIPKEERGKTGSDKNEPGDTKTTRGGIEVSDEVEKTLKDKIEAHNKANPQESQKATLGMLKAVWRRGAGAYSVGTPGKRGMQRAQWAMARVNAFLNILAGNKSGYDKDYNQDNDLLPKGHPKHSEAKMSKQYFASEDQKIIVGPAMVPDMEILRKDDKGKPYYVKFSKEVIQKVAEKFMRELRNHDTNIQHNSKDDAKTYVMETWLVENPEDKANTLYNFEVPVGTWMVKMRVTDPKIWNQIKSGELKGFSIEGNFMEKEDYIAYQKDKELYDRVIKILKSV